MKNLTKTIYDVALMFCCMLCTMSASAVPYYYVDWTSADVSKGSASGIITLPDSSTVSVQFQALNPDGSPGNLAFAQTSGSGTNYWKPDTPYISAQVDNAPPDSDILALKGGENQTYKITLSEAIKDPIMAIVSLGQTGSNTKYVFNAPFTIISQGKGYWGGGANALEQLPGNVLNGNEGHGVIQFIGTFSTFSWTVPTPEYWHGFTFGIRTTERIEPTPTTSIPQSCIAAYQIDGSLHIPYVSVPDAFGGTTLYEADMQLIPSANMTVFQLIGAKPRQQ